MMKPFTCTQCSYSSNYKHDLKRHYQIHNKQPFPQQNSLSNDQPQTQQSSPSTSTPAVDSSSNHQPQHQQMIQSHGLPAQALNLANNIQVPPTTSQIINIGQPAPSSSSTTTTTTTPLSSFHKYETKPKKTTILGDDSNEFYDIRLKENFKLFINGPSRSGKTFFLKDFIQNMDIFCKSPPKIITLVYKVFQPIYLDLNVDYLRMDCDNLKEKLLELAHGESMLVIFDDLINSSSLPTIANLFVVDGRHSNLSMIFLSQKLFIKNDYFHQISQNSDYYMLFKNPRNSQEIQTLSHQMTPGKKHLITYYKEATKNPFSYLFINLTQECKERVKYLSHLFNQAHIVNAYFNGVEHKLMDDTNHARTNFSRMMFNNYMKMMNNINHQGDHPQDYHSLRTDEASSPSSSTMERDNDTQTPPNMRSVSVGLDKRDNDTQTPSMNMRSVSAGLDKSNNDTQTPPMNMRSVSVGIDKRDNDTQTLPMNMRSVSVGLDKRDNDTQTHPKNMGSVSVGLDKRDNDTQTHPMNVRSVGVGLDAKRVVYSQTPPMNMRSVGVDQYNNNSDIETIQRRDENVGPMRIRRYVGTRKRDKHVARNDDDGDGDVSTTSERDNTDTDYKMRDILNQSTPRAVRYNPNHSYYDARYVLRKNDYSRPDREMRLNIPIYDLIRKPRYANYSNDDDDDSDVIDLDGTVDMKAIDDDNSSSITTYQNYEDGYPCDFCEETFLTVKALNRHKSNCKPTVYACTICGRNFLSRNRLSNHVRAMHHTRKDARSYVNKSSVKST